MRKSRQREAIIRVLMSTTSHPTAEWVYEEVKKEIPNVSLGTVYRNLKLLKERGEILELEQTGHYRRFDGNSANHYHFRCGAVRPGFRHRRATGSRDRGEGGKEDRLPGLAPPPGVPRVVP